MTTLGQIIFRSMIFLIILFAAILIILLVLAFSGTFYEVRSSDKSPIANLGNDELLSCFLSSAFEDTGFRKVSVTWVKKDLTGFVSQFKNGALDVEGQNSQFKGRTVLFPDAIVTGNASLLLRSVRRSDEGQYTCSISSTAGGGSVNIYLRAAAFSAPTFKFTNDVLVAEATRWYPKPNVTWSDFDGNVLSGSTSFTHNSAEIFSVLSTLQPVNVSDTYTCRIESDLVTVVSKATITGSGVSKTTYFNFVSAASSLLASTYLSILTSVLCIYCLI